MSLFLKLLALVKAAFPIPSFRDVAAVTAWLQDLAAPEADLIVAMVNQFIATRQVEIELPSGEIVTLAADSTGKVMASPASMDMLAEAIANESGEPKGKWLDLLKKLLPIILQILPFFLEPAPAPGPVPLP